MNESLQHFTVIIIGAGLAGLTATHLLKKSGVSSVLLLEASDRVGGRIRNLLVSSTVNVEGGDA